MALRQPPWRRTLSTDDDLLLAEAFPLTGSQPVCSRPFRRPLCRKHSKGHCPACRARPVFSVPRTLPVPQTREHLQSTSPAVMSKWAQPNSMMVRVRGEHYWLAKESQDPPVACFPMLGVQACAIVPTLSFFWGSNSRIIIMRSSS